jgi:hypothetical protein
VIAKAPPDDCGKYLTSEVSAALKKVAEYKEQKKKITDNPASGASEAAAQTQSAQAIQAKIDKETKSGTLTRSFNYKWIPSHTDPNKVYGNYVLVAKEIDFSPVVEKWFTAAGQQWLEMPHLPSSDVRSKLRAPYLATLAVLKSSMDRPKEPEIRDGRYVRSRQASEGLAIRDPATATLRICREGDKGCVPSAAALGDNRLVETTSDATPRIALRIPQFGRVIILTEESGLFENANLTATLNADGTISTIGFHSSSTLATAIGSIGTAASNASTAIAAQNTAIAAKNTAAAAVTTARTATVQAPDTYNKALADCLTQSAAIIKAGGTPVPCQ